MTTQNILLLIEDNPLLTGMYKTAFEKKGLEVVIAHDGDTGIELAKEKKPDIVLLDLLMPGVDGFEVLKELKKDESTKHIKVVVLTVVKDKKSQEKAEKLGAVDYLLKFAATKGRGATTSGRRLPRNSPNTRVPSLAMSAGR